MTRSLKITNDHNQYMHYNVLINTCIAMCDQLFLLPLLWVL